MLMRREIPELGPLEFKLLRTLWRISPASAKEVQEEYNRRSGKDLKYTTVMTLLTRLAEKDVLRVDRERQPFKFAPAVSREQMLRQRVHEFVDLFFDGQPVDLAVRLVEETDLSEESLRRLEETLERHKSLPRAEEEGEDLS
jgi:predicted transcriptional regulator